MMAREKKLVLAGIGIAIGLIVLVSIFASSSDPNDQRPIVSNAAAGGTKAAYVLLQRLGYRVQHSDAPLTALNTVDAEHTTLVIATPWAQFEKPEQDALGDFVKRGGHVLADGIAGAHLLPGFYWLDDLRPPERCLTTPQGSSALAHAGPVLFHPAILAKDDLLETYVAHSCMGGAAVIYYPYGKGSIVWWASVEPITNRGLHDDANLRLLMASIGGTDRTILFNEADAQPLPLSPWSKTKGIPLTALVLQLLAVLLFLFLAYGWRHGPLRTLATTPRTSPLEFAYSMGNLYHKAGAGEAAIADARLRLIHMLEQQCGIGRETVREGAPAIAASLRERFNYDSPDIIPLLEETETLKRTSPAVALTVVKRFHQVMEELEQRVSVKSTAFKENFFVRT
ncbi:DUF4350 domain-containing protein [Terriglobus sp. 2YAB30_2]|uniref:DUF4350 domain-containing protein n=3 Tax=unclassified Terriglobus TaxID=2628988 RepID=UPI003F94FBBB